MTDAPRIPSMSAAEYLAWEREQDDKHEFDDGEVFAMAGGSPRHNMLGIAVGAELRAATREHGCVVLASDQRIAAEPLERYVYADVVLICGPMLSNKAQLAIDAMYERVFELEGD
jgi:Uma2 family endonuclease